MVTVSDIKKFAPKADPALAQAIADHWGEAEAAGIVGKLRVAHFFARVATETGGLRSVEESLYYASAGRIKKVWPSRFKTLASAQPYVGKPKELAIKVYGGRMGNAPYPSTDGWDFRGGGMLQTTGRDGYRKLGYEHNPEELRKPLQAFRSAIKEWVSRNCNTLADNDDVVGVCQAINGGKIGLADQKVWLKRAMGIFNGDAQMTPASLMASTNDPLDAEEILDLQERLRHLGYPEVGNADGKYGSKTRGAILAFQADNKLMLTGKATQDVLAAVMSAEHREVSDARANPSAAVLKDKPLVKTGDTLKKFGNGLIAASGVGTIMSGSADIEQITGSVNKLKAFWETVSDLSPWIFAFAGGVVAIYLGRAVIEHFVDEYREGRSL